jgi:hypothetical protein
LARTFQRLPLGFLRVLERPGLPRRSRATEPPLVFVLALPRSGSTIAYQALVHATSPLYLSNLWNLLYFMPLAGGMLSRFRCCAHRSDFRSEYGFVRGLCGPAEGLRFWSYWHGHCLDESRNAEAMTVAARKGRPAYLRRALSGLCRPGEVVASGYIGHCLVVPDLLDKYPRAAFLRLTRDRMDNALSILKIRLRDPEAPFSVTPSELGAFAGATIHQQVAAQVWLLNRRLDTTIDPARTVTVSYEELCENPSAVLERVGGFCSDLGIPLAQRQRLPDRFERRDDADWGGDWAWHAGRLAEAFSRLDAAVGIPGAEVFIKSP